MNISEKIRISQLVVVEGKYDKIKLSSIIDGLVITLNGFRIYKDKQKSALIKALAQKQGVIILTDSDKAGFQLRGHLKSILGDIDKSLITELYIPQITGKESRKETASKEGFLGVEGTEIDLLRQMFLDISKKADRPKHQDPITKADFFNDGLSGTDNSALKRQALLKVLSLPSYISANALLEVINSLLTRGEYNELLKKVSGSEPPEQST